MSRVPHVLRTSEVRRAAMVCVMLASLVARPAAVHADVVSDWNIIALARVGASHGFPQGMIDLAVVHAAIHDAVQAYERTHQPYALSIPNASGSVIAAVATAARDVLIARLPDAQDQLVQDAYLAYMSGNGLPLNDPGVAVGSLAAGGVLALRLDDGSFPETFPAYNGAMQVGVWRPTPTAFATMTAPWGGMVRPFAIGTTAGFQPEPPPSLTSAEYAEAYNEVKKFGRASSPFRTAEQNHLIRFYSDNFVTLFHRVLRTISDDYSLDTGRRARLFALASLASADGFICAWEAKRFFSLWRPITAIREGEADGNAATIGEPGWTPQIATPPYPEYTSGANSLAAAMTRTLALFFDSDHVTFRVTSESQSLLSTDAKEITYYKFSDMAKDVIDVRILQGIHFRFGDTEARSQGRRVANHTFKNVLLPLGRRGR